MMKSSGLTICSTNEVKNYFNKSGYRERAQKLSLVSERSRQASERARIGGHVDRLRRSPGTENRPTL